MLTLAFLLHFSLGGGVSFSLAPAHDPHGYIYAGVCGATQAVMAESIEHSLGNRPTEREAGHWAGVVLGGMVGGMAFEWIR